MEDCKLLDHSIKNLNKEFAGHKCFAECHVCVSAALLLNECVLRVSQIQLSTIPLRRHANTRVLVDDQLNLGPDDQIGHELLQFDRLLRKDQVAALQDDKRGVDGRRQRVDGSGDDPPACRWHRNKILVLDPLEQADAMVE